MFKYRRILALLMAGLLMIGTGFPANAAGGTLGTDTEVTTEFSEEQEEGTSEETGKESSEVSEKASEDAGVEVSEEASEDIGVEASEEASEDTREEDSEDISENAGEETSEGAGEETTEDTSESSEETSENTPEEAGEETSEETSEEASEDASEESSEETGGEKNVPKADEITKLEESFRNHAGEENFLALVYMTDSYDVRSEADEDADTVISLVSGETVSIKELVIADNEIWFGVEYATEEDTFYGYIEKQYLIYSNEVLLEWVEKELTPFMEKGDFLATESEVTSAEEISKFPASYQSMLSALQDKYPNWHFVPFNVAENFDTAAAAEVGERSLVHSSVDSSWKGAYHSPGWYYAQPFIIRHYMDPRNFLTEKDIFQFEQLTYNESYHKTATVQAILSNSFMAGEIPGEGKTYAQTFKQAGIETTVSPYHLASRVLQEQGTAGTSPLISGTYSGYEGYYNYFNIQASGKTNEEIYRNGLAYAKQQGWNSRYKSIIGGSSFIGNGYIKVGQDTLYLQKFDMVGTLYTHQYMQNIMAPTTEGRTMYKAYSNADALDKTFVFKIPVYKNMPANPCPASQGNIFLKRAVQEGDLTAYVDCKTYTTDRDTTVQLLPFLDAATSPALAADFTWKSSDTSLAEVQADGTVLFKKPGVVTITATYKGSNSTYSGKKGTSKATVCGIWFEDGTAAEVADYTLRVGTTVPVTVTTRVASGDKTVKWSIADTSIATVDTKGNVTGLKAGKTTVTVSVGSYTSSRDIYVIPESFALNYDEMSMKRPEPQVLQVIFSEETIPEEVLERIVITYKSTNPDIATVDENGNVTPVSAGEADILVSMDSFQAVCHVNVNATVTFITGEVYETRNVPYAGTPGELPVPTGEEGSVFLGWYTEPDGKGEEFKADTRILEDMAVYAFFYQPEGGFYVKPVGDMTYTGNALKPLVEVYDGDKLLVLNKDYKLAYKNNKNVTVSEEKMPTITVTGKGNYSGKQSVTFRILPKSLSDGDITAADLTANYTGKVLATKPVVYRNGKKLALNKDYTVERRDTSVGAYKEAGKYAVTLVGKGNYAGEKEILLNIVNEIQVSKLSISSIKAQPYRNGEAICPGLTVKYKNLRLTEGKDYTLRFANNKEIGTASVTIIGMGSYTGERTLTFKITGISMKSAKVTGIEKMVYTGEAVELANPVLTLKDTVLEEGKDYTVSYTKNQVVGKATVTFTGINQYTGTIKKTFQITPYDMGEDAKKQITVTAPSTAEYRKGGARPEVTVSFGGTVLKEGKDYTLSYKNNNAVTLPETAENKMPLIVIKGKGNFKGTLNKSFVVAIGNLNNYVEIMAEDAVYKNKAGAYRKTPVLTDVNGKKLQAGKDYEKAYSYFDEEGNELGKTAIPDAGSIVRIVVKGKGPYTGSSIETTYRVVAASLANAKITVEKQVYTGEAIIPDKSDITVKIGKETLAPESYEIVSVTNNVNKGTATMVLKGTGNYGGTKKVKFTIGAKGLFW